MISSFETYLVLVHDWTKWSLLRSISDKMPKSLCNPSPGCHRGIWGAHQPIGITWEAVGVSDEGWCCIHAAMHCDVLSDHLVLLVDVFPPSLAQDLLPGPRLVSKASLITLVDELWLVLQTVLHIEGLILVEETFSGLWCSTMNSGSVLGISSILDGGPWTWTTRHHLVPSPNSHWCSRIFHSLWWFQ